MVDIDKPDKAPEKIQLKGQLKDPENYTSESNPPQKKKVAKDYSFDTKESKVAGAKGALMEAKAHLYKTVKKNMTVKEFADKFKINPREIVFVNDWHEFGIKLNQKSKFTLKGTEVWIPAQNYTRVECVQLEQLTASHT
jgi:LysM repeat protein